jgi:hypothetical protein
VLNANGDTASGTVADGRPTGIWFGANTQANLYGGGNTVNLSIGDTLVAYGSGNTINAGASASITVSGNNLAVSLSTLSRLNAIGSAGTIGFISGAQDSLTIAANTTSQSVSGFNMAHGDQIDLSIILTGVPLAHDLSNLSSYVSVSNSGANTTLQIAGAGGADTVQLTGVGSLSLQNLLNGNAFVLPAH